MNVEGMVFVVATLVLGFLAEAYLHGLTGKLFNYWSRTAGNDPWS